MYLKSTTTHATYNLLEVYGHVSEMEIIWSDRNSEYASVPHLPVKTQYYTSPHSYLYCGTIMLKFSDNIQITYKWLIIIVVHRIQGLEMWQWWLQPIDDLY